MTWYIVIEFAKGERYPALAKPIVGVDSEAAAKAAFLQWEAAGMADVPRNLRRRIKSYGLTVTDRPLPRVPW